MTFETSAANGRRGAVSRRLLLALAGLALAIPCVGQPPKTEADQASDQIKQLIAKYAAAADGADVELASQVWDNSPDVSFIHPQGHARGWEEVKNFYRNTMGAPFSERKLTIRDITLHVYGDSAWAEFYWHFEAKLRSNGSTVVTDGRETQIYRKVDPGRWVLVHVHYSGMPVTAARRGF
ncbi:MAG: nuclear transport factor 2 family protein [Bryobacteraceae bacterium]|jgi:ketosteroid isomerase-like protein